MTPARRLSGVFKTSTNDPPQDLVPRIVGVPPSRDEVVTID